MLKNVLSLWAAPWRFWLALPLITVVGIFFVSLWRLYKALIVTGSFIVLMCVAALAYAGYACYPLSLVALALIGYLARPSIARKDHFYMMGYGLQTAVCLAFLLLVFTVSTLVIPHCLRGIFSVFFLIVTLFLYDYQAIIPKRCGAALIKSSLFIVYNIPGFALAMGLLCLSDYLLPAPLLLSVVYPIIGVWIAGSYVVAIHQNYEWYYAE